LVFAAMGRRLDDPRERSFPLLGSPLRFGPPVGIYPVPSSPDDVLSSIPTSLPFPVAPLFSICRKFVDGEFPRVAMRSFLPSGALLVFSNGGGLVLF